jgi:hypothetical protein
MKSTKSINTNLTRTLLIILGIMVALLLTFNSGLIGESASLSSGFRIFMTKAETVSTTSQIEQMKHLVAFGKDIYFQIDEFITKF